MHDRRYLRDNPAEAQARLTLRGPGYRDGLSRFAALDEERRSAQGELDALRQERNERSKAIGELMKSAQREQAEAARGEVRALGDRLAELETRFAALEAEEQELLLGLPNFPADGIPEGGEDAAVVVKQWRPGSVGAELAPPAHYESGLGGASSASTGKLDHVELCHRLQLVNFEAGTRLSGSGFPVLTGAGAMLQRALINFMLDVHIQRHGYTEVRPPFLVRPEVPLGTGNLPKFGDQMYRVLVGADGVRPVEEGQTPSAPTLEPDFYLIPTAEVPIANIYREQILEQPTLPIKFCAHSPCFRVEAGSYGKDVRGLTRLHQFEKVELVRIADPETSWDDHEQMTAEAEYILETLGLAYRRKLLPTGDMAFASAKTYDLEVWAPGAAQWLEVSSASNTTDFQARRMNLRFRREAGGKPEHPHLLNASGLALPRLMIALLETYQTAEGNVALPEVLRGYMPELEITPPGDGAVPFV
jgi:seryl-tRNA synthetase